MALGPFDVLRNGWQSILERGECRSDFDAHGGEESEDGEHDQRQQDGILDDRRAVFFGQKADCPVPH